MERIQAELDRIEEDENICILYACESGSRAWGFASRDSDFDVRFIYIRPPGWYLSIQKRRDVVETWIGDDLDISGWDLVKALDLYRKSNPPLLEWLQSPTVYKERGTVAKKLRELMGAYHSPVSCMYHYLHMAQRNHRGYLKGDIVRIKKYFYVLRPILACMWIEGGWGVVPMEFDVLVDRLITDKKLREAIDRLLLMKKSGNELGKSNRIAEISEFIERELTRLSAIKPDVTSPKNPNTLDDLFLQTLVETYGNTIELNEIG